MYAVVEICYSSTSGQECKCKKVFSSLDDAKAYVKKELQGDLAWYKSNYVDLKDKDEVRDFEECLKVLNDDERMVYGIYPYNGEKRWFEYHINKVSLVK